MMSKISEVFKKMLNDRELFDSPYDKKTGVPIPKLFEGDSWKELGKLFNQGKKEKFIERIDSRIKELENQEQKGSRWRRDKINELKQRAERLKLAFDSKPYLLKALFENLSWYGIVECKLPAMEEYGKVIERYDMYIVEQYFVDKIKRATYPQNRALAKLLEYIKELNTAGTTLEEIAYSVRKIESLTKYWEVI